MAIIQNVLPYSYQAIVDSLISGGNGRGVSPTPKRDVITASAGQTSHFTLTVGVQQEILLIAQQRVQANPYGADYTLSLAIDGTPILSSFALTQEIVLPGANLPPARNKIEYTLTNSAASGDTTVTIDTFGATLSTPNAEQIQRLLRRLYEQVLGAEGGGF